MFSQRPSEIHGCGCFTNQKLVKGNKFVIPAYRVPEETYHTIRNEDDGSIWDLYPPFRYLNHSDKPNARLGTVGNKFFLVILKSIAADAEVTIDYDQMEEL